jgi:hypothetical protein
MVSGIRFFACSGALGGTASIRAIPNIEIFNFEPRATNSPNRMGFFGVGGAPNSPVIVGFYQDRTHRCDHLGADLGQMVNVKFNGSTGAFVSGVNISVTGHALEDIPQNSGTLLCRFTEPNGTAVITQNGVFRAINLTAASGAADVTGSNRATGVTIQAAQLADTDGEGGDTSWTTISSGGSDLGLADQSASATIHDYHLIVSATPSAAGRKIDFAYYIQLEFL